MGDTIFKNILYNNKIMFILEGKKWYNHFASGGYLISLLFQKMRGSVSFAMRGLEGHDIRLSQCQWQDSQQCQSVS